MGAIAAAALCVAVQGAWEWPPAGVMVTIASGIAILGRPESALWDLFASPDAKRPSAALLSVEQSLCRRGGWDLRCEVGPEAARAVGGTGALARRRDSQGGVALSISLVLERDQRLAVPSGPARLVRPSRFFAPVGSWQVEAVDEATMAPSAIAFQLLCTGLESGGEVLVKQGPVYLRASVERDTAAGRVLELSGGGAGGEAAVRLVGGTIAVEEDIGLGFAEFKLVGAFEARPALRQPDNKDS
jgi:hypothetical protein